MTEPSITIETVIVQADGTEVPFHPDLLLPPTPMPPAVEPKAAPEEKPFRFPR